MNYEYITKLCDKKHRIWPQCYFINYTPIWGCNSLPILFLIRTRVPGTKTWFIFVPLLKRTGPESPLPWFLKTPIILTLLFEFHGAQTCCRCSDIIFSHTTMSLDLLLSSTKFFVLPPVEWIAFVYLWPFLWAHYFWI